MGRSDPVVFDFYSKNIDLEKEYDSVGFFGQCDDNHFTSKIKSNSRNFYDIQLNNWNINDTPYEIDKKFDLIVCTRCAYFAKNPELLISSFCNLLKSDGLVFIDWGVGDHWRFENFKVGWVKNGEHEYAYDKNNFLWSFVWHRDLEKHPESVKFQEEIKKFGYSNLETAIKEEVPALLFIDKISHQRIKIECNMLSLWPDSPQLYLLLKIRKN